MTGFVEDGASGAEDDDANAIPLGFTIRALHNMIKRYLSVTMPQEARDATAGNVGILIYLDKHSDREVFPQDIENQFSITRSTVSRVLALMERKGMIRREPVLRDARLKRIVPTDRAHDIAQSLRDNADRADEMLLSGFSDEESAELRRLLLKVKGNLIATGKVCKTDACRDHGPEGVRASDRPPADSDRNTESNREWK